MKKLFGFLTLIFSAVPLFAQSDASLLYSTYINASELEHIVSELSSVAIGSRETNTHGNKLAARYLTDYLKRNSIKSGNKGSYLQDLQAYHMQNAEKKFMVNNFNYKNDYTYGNNPKQAPVVTANEVYFAGYGIYSASYNDFENININNKVVMIMEGGSPMSKFGISYTGDRQNTYSTEYVYEQKPKAILNVRTGYAPFSQFKTNRVVFDGVHQTDKTIPEITINELLANRILSSTNLSIKEIQFEIEQTGKSNSFNITTPVSIHGNYYNTSVDANNIIGIIEGRDLKNEYIILCAHYDGLKGSSGANNNASGVAAVLEIARAFSMAQKEGKGPRRSIIFLLTTAKEQGLYGSSYYVNNPLYPLENTVACLNLDKLGCVGEEYKERNENYMYIVNHVKMSEDIVYETILTNEESTLMTLDLVYKYPDDPVKYLEQFDQYNFMNKNIPSVTFTDSSHKDYLDKDNIKNIDFKKLQQRTELIFLTTWRLANQ